MALPWEPQPLQRNTFFPGGQQMDYQKMLAGDPIRNAIMAQLQAQGSSYRGGLTADRQRALIQFGGIPGQSVLDSLNREGVPGVGSDITDLTRQLAQQNTAGGASTLAQLQHAYKQANSASVGDLGARGIIRSGAYGQHAGENLRNFNLGNYQASQGLTDYLSGLQSGYMEHQQGLVAQGTDATNQALGRITDNITNEVIAGPAAASVPNVSPAATPRPVARPSIPGVTGGTFQAKRHAFPIPMAHGSFQAPRPVVSHHNPLNVG